MLRSKKKEESRKAQGRKSGNIGEAGKKEGVETLSKESLVKFAEDVYDLDQQVYQAVGSDLGRVFGSDRKRSIRVIMNAVEHGSDHIIRSEVALIGNMARTISDDDVRREIMGRYDEIMTRMDRILTGNYDVGILNQRQASMDLLNLKDRFKDADHRIICISRSYGCGGGSIGFGLADALHMDFYDAEIFSAVLHRLEAENMGIPDEEQMEPLHSWDKIDEKQNPGLSYEDRKVSIRKRLRRLNQYHGLPTKDAVFFNQTDLILDLAKRKDFVVMGRCADQILSNHDIPHVSIFLTAPEERRIERAGNINHVDYKTAKKQVREVDKAHAKYYRYFTGKQWGEAKNYDLCINTSIFGVQGTIDFILGMIGAPDKRKKNEVRAENIKSASDEILKTAGEVAAKSAGEETAASAGGQDVKSADGQAPEDSGAPSKRQ